jgi:glycosyltransferase involved in cell wall biosynthesis
MRIAYITETYPPEVNGVSLTVKRTVDYLRSRGHELQLIRPLQPGEPPRDDADEWRTAGMPLPMYRDLRMGWAFSATLAARFDRFCPDVVHIATEGPLGLAAMCAAGRRALPVTSDFRTNFHAYSRYYRLGFLSPVIGYYLRTFHNRGRHTFVPSRTIKRELAGLGFRRLQVIGRGVDSTLFSPARRSARLRSEWGASDEQQRVLLYVGRLAREKNIGLALRAHAAVHERCAGARMVVVGDGPLRRQLESDFPQVRFVGLRRGEDLATHYASADLFVFPSQSETFGNVTLEAMASGLAVIGFNSAAAADLLRNGDNGFVVALGDDAAFAGAVCACAAMTATALARMRAQARATALNLGWDNVLGGFERRLEQIAAARAVEGLGHVVTA